MDTRELLTFVTVSETLSYPKAAERLAEACRAWQRAHRTEQP